MDAPLRLEYTCTPAEISEAQELALAQQAGGGSKSLGVLVMIAFMAVLLVLLYFQVRSFVGQWGVYGYIPLALAIGALFILRKKEPPAQAVVAEISETEITFILATARACMPWASFDKVWESEKLFALRQKGQAVAHIFPKRAFPDEASCMWFRDIAHVAVGFQSQAETPAEPDVSADTPRAASAGEVTLRFKLRYRDYLDRGWASWLTRGAICFIVGVMLIAWISASFEPEPDSDAVFTNAEVWLYFSLPTAAFLACGMFFFISTWFWLQHLSALTVQTVTLMESGYSNESRGEKSELSWDGTTAFKETRWSFIVWRPGTQVWMLLPKRAFPSAEAVETCRRILKEHARRSTWFF